ncbi:MAG: rRNA small subunit methyltransferase 1 [Holophagales bacterium]|nr:rRNA small subunit methyltransferase 1 [Holophagales bacterium]
MTATTAAPGRLLVVATPIGNLEDLSPRALAALRDASLVLCEDTRRTGNLFSRYGVTTPRVSCHEHNEFRRIPEVLQKLAAGETLALVSDAGTPGVSDPGRLLTAAAAAAGYRVEPIAGPSAVAAILSVCGFPAIPFSFLGFPPSRHGERSRWYARFAPRDETRILFESPFRVVASLEEMARAWGDPAGLPRARADEAPRGGPSRYGLGGGRAPGQAPRHQGRDRRRRRAVGRSRSVRADAAP